MRSLLKFPFFYIILTLIGNVKAVFVYIPDRALKTTIEEALWIDDPTPTDMLDLIELRGISQNIEDLTGLEYAINLKTLLLRYNHISDVSPLSSCTQLEVLNLSDNKILSNLTPLAGLVTLRDLDCHANQITDLSFTLALTNLERLVLRTNGLSGISDLARLTNLHKLQLEWNQIDNLASLSGLINLIQLNVSGNQISDISALSGLIQM